MLNIKNLHASIEDKPILKGIDLIVNPGEVHAIMGPNGSGKSTLASILAGREEYTVNEGSIEFNGKDLLEMAPEERAGEGVFLAFQYPVEIPGVSTANFLKTALNEIRKYRGLETIDAMDFLALRKEKAKLVELDMNSKAYTELDFEYNIKSGEITATRHLLSVATDIMNESERIYS